MTGNTLALKMRPGGQDCETKTGTVRGDPGSTPVASLMLPLILYLRIRPLSYLTFSKNRNIFIVCIKIEKGSQLNC